MLRQSWYTQNYVASHFLEMIPPLADETGTRDEFVESLAIAKANDAKTLVNRLKNLPQDWQDAIAAS